MAGQLSKRQRKENKPIELMVMVKQVNEILVQRIRSAVAGKGEDTSEALKLQYFIREIENT